jgi:hypothetical protein
MGGRTGWKATIGISAVRTIVQRVFIPSLHLSRHSQLACQQTQCAYLKRCRQRNDANITGTNVPTRGRNLSDPKIIANRADGSTFALPTVVVVVEIVVVVVVVVVVTGVVVVEVVVVEVVVVVVVIGIDDTQLCFIQRSLLTTHVYSVRTHPPHWLCPECRNGIVSCRPIAPDMPRLSPACEWVGGCMIMYMSEWVSV